jgi:hypothetical protein
MHILALYLIIQRVKILWFGCLVVAVVLKLLYCFFGYNHKKYYNDSSCQKSDTYLDLELWIMSSATWGQLEVHFDEDIATLDTPTLWSSPSCNSSPTQLPRHPRIQQTHRHYFGHNFLIRHRNGTFLDALERGWRRRRFGSGPSSRRSVDHSVWPWQCATSPI